MLREDIQTRFEWIWEMARCWLLLTILFQCETIVEDNEDVFTAVLSKENPNPVDEICVDQTNLCSKALRDEL